MSLPDALVPVTRDPEGSVLMVDFDGSLARIVRDPADARPLSASVEALERLVGALGQVAVISGRPAAFLADRLPLPGLTIVGLYGLERVADGKVVAAPGAERWRDALADAADEAEARLPGLLVERKSGLSVTVHWRTDPGRAAEAIGCVTELGARFGLRGPEHGRMAAELRVPVDVDKGLVATELARSARHAVFAGDDAGDVLAFDAIRRLQGEGTLQHAVCIGVTSPEMPAPIGDADVVVDGPDGLADLLSALARSIQRA